jgi:hypothetical protein
MRASGHAHRTTLRFSPVESANQTASSTASDAPIARTRSVAYAATRRSGKWGGESNEPPTRPPRGGGIMAKSRNVENSPGSMFLSANEFRQSCAVSRCGRSATSWGNEYAAGLRRCRKSLSVSGLVSRQSSRRGQEPRHRRPKNAMVILGISAIPPPINRPASHLPGHWATFFLVRSCEEPWREALGDEVLQLDGGNCALT